MKTTLKDVARLARTSKSTVSRVLLGQADVNVRTRRRVQHAIEHTGYRPNLFARGLVGGRTGIIAALGQWMDGLFVTEALRGIHDEAAGNDRYVLSRFASTPAEYVQEWQRLAQGGAVDGIVLLAPPLEIFRHPMKSEGVPMALCACRPPENRRGWSRVDSVALDNDRAMIDLLLHLVDQGCRRIVHLEGARNDYDTVERSRSFIRFTERYQEVVGDVIPAGERRDLVRVKFREYLDRSPDWPDAVVGFNDDIAMGALDALRERGLSVPLRMAVTGFDNSDIADAVGLTSVSVPAFAAGRESVRLVLARLNREISGNKLRQVMMPLPLQVRASSLLRRRDRSVMPGAA